jgi:hypothetical protein
MKLGEIRYGEPDTHFELVHVDSRVVGLLVACEVKRHF